LELNGTHQLLVYAIIFIYWVKINTQKNAEAQLDARREVGREGNAEKTKYMFMSHHHAAGQNDDVK
jgi:hypothetical protein